MVQKLAEQGIEDEAVLAAMGQIERDRFVDSALVNQAYEDTSLPIGLGQTISKPNVVARMIALLRQAPLVEQGQGLGRVLEIGTGCGYQAAVIALLIHPSARSLYPRPSRYRLYSTTNTKSPRLNSEAEAKNVQ